MISIENDFILRNLSDDISYENTISKECFEPLVIRTSDTMKYIKSSTGLYLPVYQPNPTDVLQNWGGNSSQWAYFCASSVTTQNRSCRAKYDANGKPQYAVLIGYTDRYVNNRLYEQKIGYGFSRTDPVSLKMFNPDTNTYEEVYLRYTAEYKYYQPGTTNRKLRNPYLYNSFWEDANGNRTYIFEGCHFNILDGEDYPTSGVVCHTSRPYAYMYADIGYDILNNKWVGLLNLFLDMYGCGYGYDTNIEGSTMDADGYTAYGVDRQMIDANIGPFSSISTKSYSDACGPMSGLQDFYMRAFELDSEFELDIESKNISMNKIEVVGPNTRIAT